MTRWTPEAGHCFIIGEVGLSHEGSLGMAHAYIDTIARAGAHAVKFQTHIAEAESTIKEPFRVRMSGQDATRYDYWKRTSFDEDGWAALVRHAHERNLCFISSPFSFDAVELLARVGADVLKVASGETANLPLIERCGATGLPVMLSSGMSGMAEVADAAAAVRKYGAPLGIFQCTSAYPCPPEKLGLNMLAEYRARFGCPVGLSDHSGKIYAGLAAATLGCDLLEVHVCFSREMYGPDVPASLLPEDLARLVEGISFIEAATANPVDKDREAAGLDDMRRLFTKSIVAARALPMGTVIDATMLAFKKPGIGIPAARSQDVIGRVLRHSVEADHFFSAQDFTEASA